MEQEVFEHKLVKVCKQAEDQIHESKLKHRQSFSMGTLSTMVIR